MKTQYWDKPVDLELHGNGRYRTVTATGYASEILKTLWPARHGPAYFDAMRICDEALEGKTSASEARKAFIKAACEASIPVSDA